MHSILKFPFIAQQSPLQKGTETHIQDLDTKSPIVNV